MRSRRSSLRRAASRSCLLPLDEYNSWKETIYLLANPANAEHLRRSIAEAEAGEARERGAPRRMKLTFTPSAWDDYLWFQEQDRKLLKRIGQPRS